MLVNNDSGSYKTYSSSFNKDNNAFNIFVNFRQLLILYSLHAGGLIYFSVTSVVFSAVSYVAVPVCSTIGLNSNFSTVI